MKIPLYIVDAFTRKRFHGNPAAVCILESMPGSEVLQAIAAENNLSETAFVFPQAERYRLRWFTPTVEVPLCGHATLASAHVLFNHLHHAGEIVHFITQSGVLSASRGEERILLDFPMYRLRSIAPPSLLSSALKTKLLEVYETPDTWCAVVACAAEVASMSPDMQKLMDLPVKNIIVTAPGEPTDGVNEHAETADTVETHHGASRWQVDFVSRFFGPQLGIPEDPVTGSAHCTLIPYWSARLGKNELHARQLSKRGGEIYCRNNGDSVTIGGCAVTYAQGTIEM